ncbi:MAG: hypothetical protein JST04_00210 [Bdellovibrionales bacterium]|nr:hypothetical protein [Bdellovibrionales bacterium]
MKNVLIYYATTEGQTAKIAEAIAQELAELGFAVHLVRSGDAEWTIADEPCDGVILGSSVHRGRYPEAFRRQVARNAEKLREIPVAFFSVCLGVLETENVKTQEAERGIVRDFLEDAGIRPVHRGIFAGALRYSQYGLFKRVLLHAIAKRAGRETRTDRDYEFTDWEEVKGFARDFADHLKGKRGAIRNFPGAFRTNDDGGKNERPF